MELSRLVQEQIRKPSPIREIMKMADRKNIINMGLNPDEVISFGGGWVNHPAPESFREKYIEICTDTKLFHDSGGYSPTPGIPECRELIAEMEREIFKMHITEKNIIIGQSSTQVTYDAMMTVANPDDTVLLFDPTYANYLGQIEFSLPNAKIVRLRALDPDSWQYFPDVDNTVEEFKETFERFRPRIVLFSAPDNPTGQMPPMELVKAIADVTLEGKAFLMIDYAYKTQYFDDAPPEYFSWSPEDFENLIALHSNSKWCRGLGRRLGWIEASELVIYGMERTQQCSILCPDTLHQMAMVSYLRDALSDGSLRRYLDENRVAYKRASELTVSGVDEHMGMPRLIPHGGLYTVVRVDRKAVEFVLEILKNTGVLFIPGDGFGESLAQGIRISYGPLVNELDKIKEGFERVGRYLGNA